VFSDILLTRRKGKPRTRVSRIQIRPYRRVMTHAKLTTPAFRNPFRVVNIPQKGLRNYPVVDILFQKSHFIFCFSRLSTFGATQKGLRNSQNVDKRCSVTEAFPISKKILYEINYIELNIILKKLLSLNIVYRRLGSVTERLNICSVDERILKNVFSFF